MEKVPGIELESVWEDITGRQKYEIVRQLVGFEKSFAATRFTAFGSLYYAVDVPKVSGDETLCVTEHGTEIKCSQFAIGPSNNRKFFDDGRGTVSVNRGPCRNYFLSFQVNPISLTNLLEGRTTEDYAIDSARREIACTMALREFPRPQGLFYGPGQYRPSPTQVIDARQLPESGKTSSTKGGYFEIVNYWHSDLHTNNIFVDPEDPTKIVGIIDWQSVHLSPFFLQARYPALIDFDGPIPEGLGRIELPQNFEQKEAKMLRSAQSLYKLYEVEIRQRNKDVFRALQYRETLACKITALAGSLFSDGEPIVNGLLMAVERE